MSEWDGAGIHGPLTSPMIMDLIGWVLGAGLTPSYASTVKSWKTQNHCFVSAGLRPTKTEARWKEDARSNPWTRRA